MQNTTTNVLCTYTLSENGIHEYHILEPSRAAIDEWLQMMTTLVEMLNQQESNDPVLMIVDYSTITAGAPINYVMTSLQRWNKTVYRRRRAHVGVIMGNSAIISVVDLMLRTFRLADTVHLFRSNDKEPAYAWLEKMRKSHF